jgi:4-amino-4-deoxy-L-arabinose transferase-like glycosyltransferase
MTTAGDAPVSSGKAPRAPWGWHVLGLLVLAGWVACQGLTQPALVDPDEPRTAIVARLMAEQGDWLSPHLPAAFQHDYPHDPVEGDLLAYWDKPPLYFWLSGACMTAWCPSALAARLPAALAFVATVLLVYAAGRFLWGGGAGFLAGVVMAVSPLPLAMAHVARMDSLLAALMAALLLAILKLLYAPSRGASEGHASSWPQPDENDGTQRRASLHEWFWVGVLYVSAGLGLLAKGPAAVALPAAAVLGTRVLTGRWRDLLRLRPLTGAVIALAVAAPWYLYMHFRYPAAADGSHAGYLYEFLVRQNLGRATGGEYEHSRFVPGILVAIFLGGLLPWAAFLPAACRELAPEGWRERRRRPALVLLGVWVAVVIGVFSLSRTQLAHYVLPAFPPAALVLGLYFSRCLAPDSRRRAFRAGLVGTTVVGGLLMAAGIILMVRYGLWQAAFWPYAVVMGALLVLGIAALMRRRHWNAFGYLAASVAVIASFVLTADPAGLYRKNSTYASVLAMDPRGPASGDVITAYPHPPYSFAWYLWGRLTLLPPGGVGDRPEDPTEASLVKLLNEPHRTFCSLQKHDMVERLRRQVRWPLRVVSGEKAQFTVIVTEPSPGGDEPCPLPL